MKPKLILCLTLVLCLGLMNCLSASKANPVVPSTKAPKLQNGRTADISQLGLWDDAFHFDDLDFIFLRRGGELFSYSLITSEQKKFGDLPVLNGTHVVDGVVWSNRQWVFCEAKAMTPFAVDLKSGEKVEFEIPGLKLSKERTVVVETGNIVAHAGGAILALGGGEEATWPRDGNRPVYYWMSLNTGKATLLPVGWDLDFFSADQKLVVFGTPPLKQFERGPRRAVDIQTGLIVESAPDQTKELWTGRKSEGRSDVWEVRGKHSRKDRADDNFAGLSVNGIVYPADVPASRSPHTGYKANDAQGVFRLDTDSDYQAAPLWILKLGSGNKPTLLATNVRNFELLGNQYCAFSTSIEDVAPADMDFFVYDNRQQKAWDALDGIERLPKVSKLPKELAVQYKMNVNFIPSFGSLRQPPLLLCLSHGSYPQPSNIPLIPEWRYVLLLSAEGKRIHPKLPKDKNDPESDPVSRAFAQHDTMWLHHSGKLVIGEQLWLPMTDRAESVLGKIKLSLVDFHLDEK